jgi:hypothetical protein
MPIIERSDLPPSSSSSFGLLVILAGVSFVAHMLVAGNYGYFRDELYYIADGQHLQAGYVDQPLLMGWLAALMRVIADDNLVAIHVIPALACALIIIFTGLMARELGGGRISQLVAGVTALFTVNFMATGSLFSMDVLDQLWWSLASLILIRLLRQEQERNMDAPRLWLLVGLVMGIALLTKLTVLYFGAALALALLVTPERRYLRTPWPWLAGGIAFMGLLPYLIWNALNGWPTLEFWRNYGVRSGPLDFFSAQIVQMNPIALPLAVAGLVFYFRSAGAQYRLLGWVFVFAYLILTLLGTKAYFLAPAYPILFAAGGIVFERLRLRPWLAWTRLGYVALLVIVAILLAPVVMPILPPATVVAAYGSLPQPLSDRLGWDSLTRTVEQVYDALPPEQRAQACVLTSNYGEAGALQHLAAPGRLPPVISGHNNYFLWGPGACTGQVLIAVGYSPADFQGPPTHYAHITLAATERCDYCISYEDNLPITVVSGPTESNPIRLWPSVKHYE